MSTLGPAFSYSPSTSTPTSPPPKSKHAPNPSLSSLRSLATTSSASNRSSYTSSYCSYRDTEGEHEGEDDDDRSILEDLLENLSSNPRSSDYSPPRIPTSDSSHQLRERTRYRSSASIHPLAPTTSSSSSTSHSPSSMDLSAFLASLPPSLDKCFCGQEVEEDSIYCSRLCAQEDALNALCGASSGAEDSDRASLVSGSSGSASQSGESHYRRVEREEVRREKERQAKIARERAVARRRAREGESVSSAGSTGSKKGSLWRNNVDVGSLKTASTSTSSSSNRAGTPSLSSSVSSLASTPSITSPISPSFPRTTSSHAHKVPQISTPIILAPSRPTTPSPPSPLRDVSDIYSSYLATTPLAPSSEDSKLLRTPRQNDGSTPRSAYPQTPYDDDEEEEDDSPTGRAARMRGQRSVGECGVSDVGLRMLELCSSYPSSPSQDFLSESLDQVYTEAPSSLGWGHREMQERMNQKQGRKGPSSGHSKGKLSFDDVVGILGA